MQTDIQRDTDTRKGMQTEWQTYRQSDSTSTGRQTHTDCLSAGMQGAKLGIGSREMVSAVKQLYRNALAM
jgi:hypothetical protein